MERETSKETKSKRKGQKKRQRKNETGEGVIELAGSL